MTVVIGCRAAGELTRLADCPHSRAAGSAQSYGSRVGESQGELH